MSARYVQRLADGITAREIQVLDQVSQGYSNREIARSPGIAENTVKAHLNHVGTKVGCGDRAGQVGIAYRSGLLPVGVRAS